MLASPGEPAATQAELVSPEKGPANATSSSRPSVPKHKTTTSSIKSWDELAKDEPPNETEVTQPQKTVAEDAPQPAKAKRRAPESPRGYPENRRSYPDHRSYPDRRSYKAKPSKSATRAAEPKKAPKKAAKKKRDDQWDFGF